MTHHVLFGNRVRMVDAVTDRHTVYSYDTDLDPDEEEGWPDPDYRTRNNRLLSYEIYDGDPADPNDSTLLRTVRYTYYKTGDVSNITIKDEFVNGVTPGSSADYDWHYDLALYYYLRGDLRLAISDRWKMALDPNDVPMATDYEALSAREVRYDQTRARYLAADYECNDSADPNDWSLVEGAVRWTEYEGVRPYTDGAIEEDGSGGLTFARSLRYLCDGAAGDTGLTAQQTLVDGDPDETTYLHGDLIDSSVMTTDDNGNGAGAATTAYTAFGDVAGGHSALGTRYQYAGAFGYESGLLSVQGANADLPPITLQHLGARWYQPSLGRFVQRDPIGIRGGLNGYAYCHEQPTDAVDPSGWSSLWPNTGIIRYGPSRIGFNNLGKGVYRLAFRAGTSVHVYGARGAAMFGGSVLGAACIGFAAGTLLDHYHPGTQDPYSSNVGQWLYDLAPDFWRWTVSRATPEERNRWDRKVSRTALPVC